MSVVEDILDDHRERKTADLLQHPLIASFLYLKWRKIRMLFFSNVITYLILVAGVTAYVWTALTRNSDQESQHNGTLTIRNNTSIFPSIPNLRDAPPVLHLQFALIIVIGIILCQEFIQFLSLHAQYFQEAESYIKWGALVTSSIVIISPTPWEEWVHFVSAWAVLLGWTEVTLLLGRLPSFGVYALMFYSVAQHLAKFVFVFFFFLAGFSFSFHIIFSQDKEAFANPWTALLRTLSMMIGDLSYDDYLTKDNFKLPVTAHLIYFLFLILVALILMNLLIGLAVNDIQGLQKEGRVKRLRKQAQFIVYLEDVINNRMLRFCLCNNIVKKLNNWVNQEPVFATNPSARKQKLYLPSSIIEHALSIAHDKRKPVDTLTLSDTYNLVQECVASIDTLRLRIDNLERGLIGSNQKLFGAVESTEHLDATATDNELNGVADSHPSLDNTNDNEESSSRDSDVMKTDTGITDDELDEIDHRSHRKLTMKKSRQKTIKRSMHSDLQEIKALLLEIKALKNQSSV